MYFREFESYKGFLNFKNPIFFFFIIFLLLFFIFILNYFDVFNLNRKYLYLREFSLPIAIVFEVFLIELVKGLEKQRDAKIIEKYKLLYKKDLNINEIKYHWFKNTIDVPFSEYGDLAEKIDKYYLLEKKYSKPSLSRHNIAEFIFSADSKNRTLAMFMGLVALFTGLCIASGVNIEYVFAILSSVNYGYIFFTIFFISIVIFLFIYMLKYICIIAINIFDFIFDNYSNSNKTSKRKKEIFITELIKLYQIPKKKHKVYFEL